MTPCIISRQSVNLATLSLKKENLKIKIRAKIFHDDDLEFHASCSEGLAELLEEEIRSYKLLVTDSNRGGVFFRGNKKNLTDFILNTGLSSRISFNLLEFKGKTEDDIYHQAKKYSWEKLIPTNKTFKIESHTKEPFKNSQYTLYKLKDAILDRAREKGFHPPVIERENPDILLSIRNNMDSVKINVSITPYPLNQRGYRVRQHEAPVKETVAQAMIRFSGWDKKQIMIDPMCGSGTILIEAALLAREAPLNKDVVKSYIFTQLFGEIKIAKIKETTAPILFGYDLDAANIRNSLINASAAGVDHLIKFRVKDARKLDNPGLGAGIIITNPPYGIRLSNKEDLKILYEQVGKIIKERFPGFTFTVISGETSLLGYFKLKADKSMNLKIADLKAKIVNYKII